MVGRPVESHGWRERENFTSIVRVRALFQMSVYQMVSNGTDRVLVLRDTNARRVWGRFPRVADSAMSFRTTAFRVSIFLGLATLVAAILWLTPPPREYWARVGLGLALCMKTNYGTVEPVETMIELRTKWEIRTNESFAVSQQRNVHIIPDMLPHHRITNKDATLLNVLISI